MIDKIGFHQAFGSLRAEVEAPWLAKVFVPPLEFSSIKEPYSTLIFGNEGSGKTALEIHLKTYALSKEGSPSLVASWQPSPPSEEIPVESVEQYLLSQLLDSLCFSILQFVVQNPRFYLTAAVWAQEFLQWFLQRYVLDDPRFELSRLAEQSVPEGLEAARHLLTEPARSVFSQPMAIATVLTYLTGAIKNMGCERIWIFVDGKSAFFRTPQGRLEQFLDNFHVVLGFFSDPAFVCKIFFPDELGKQLMTRHAERLLRINIVQLNWERTKLANLIEKRVAFILHREDFSLHQLCNDKNWFNWLEKYGGDSPRGWLALAKPFVDFFLEKKQKRLSETEWQDVFRSSPPSLRVDMEAQRAFIGYAEVPIGGVEYKLLSYLYKSNDRLCSKSELYYRAHKGLPYVPQSLQDERWDDPSSWDGMINTALWRLRQEIEWSPSHPLYIITERRRGFIQLKHAI